MFSSLIATYGKYEKAKRAVTRNTILQNLESFTLNSVDSWRLKIKCSTGILKNGCKHKFAMKMDKRNDKKIDNRAIDIVNSVTNPNKK